MLCIWFPWAPPVLTLNLVKTRRAVLSLYLDEPVEHHVRVERVSALPGGLDDGVDVLVPEDAVGRVDLGDVAEQPLRVDLVQDRVALQVQQAVEEKLQE